MRNYTKGNQSFVATIIIGTNAIIQGQTQSMNVETSEAKVNISEVDGFTVMRTFDKNDKIGQIVITLAKKQSEGAMFVNTYEGISDKEAFEMALKFDWKKMKASTAKLLK